MFFFLTVISFCKMHYWGGRVFFLFLFLSLGLSFISFIDFKAVESLLVSIKTYFILLICISSYRRFLNYFHAALFYREAYSACFYNGILKSKIRIDQRIDTQARGIIVWSTYFGAYSQSAIIISTCA